MSDEKKSETVLESKSETTSTPKKGNSGLIVIIVVVLVILCCCGSIIGGLFWYASNYNPNNFNDYLRNFNGNTRGSTTPPTPSSNPPSAGSGISVNLSAGFPSDVPIFPNAKVLYSAKNDDNTYGASLSVDASNQAVIDFYKQEIEREGWTIESEGTFLGYVITAKKDSRTLGVVVIQLDEANGQAVQSVTLSVSAE